MKNQKRFRSGAFFVAGLLFASGANAELTGITSPVDTSGGNVTNNETISGNDNVTVTGGKMLLVGGTGCTLSGDWIIESGTTLATNNYAKSKATPDDVLGSGKIYLNGGTIRTVQTGKTSPTSAWDRSFSNDVVINGNCTFASDGSTEMYVFGNISGTGKITESVSYSLRLRGDNSAYTGDWGVTGDWVWTTGSDSKTSFGTGGTVTVTGGGIGLVSADYTFSNNLEISGSNATLFKDGTKLTISGKITGTGAFNFKKTYNGSTGALEQNTPATLVLTGDNSGYTGNWNITGYKAANGNVSWQTVVTNNAGSGAKQTADSRFGSGTINLNYGILQGSVHPTSISNNIVVTNEAQLNSAGNQEMNLYGNISGSGLIQRNVAWSTRLLGDNSAYTGDWNLNSDWTWAYNSGQTEKVGTGDYSFGSGTVHAIAGGIALGVTNLTLSANLDVQGYNAIGTAFKGGTSATLTGKLTGTADFKMNKDSTPAIYLQGDGSEYTKNWIIDATASASSLAVISNSTATVADGVDKRFGSGTIYLKGGDGTTGSTARLGGSVNGVRIYNPVVASGNVVLDDTAGSEEVHFAGNISGSGTITDSVGWTFYLEGDNSAYTGDWYIPGDYCCIVNDGKTASVANPDGDLRFGTGTVYLNGGGIRTTGAGVRGFIDADIVVPTGATGSFRYGPFTIRGSVTANGTMVSDTANGDPIVTFADGGLLQGDGTVSSLTIIGENGILTAGTVGTTGALSFTRTLEMAAGSTLALDFLSDTDYDKIIVQGAATISPEISIDLNLTDGYLPKGGSTFDILQVGEGSTIPSDWNALLSPDMAYIFNASFNNGTLTLTTDGAAVPEPATWALLVCGLGLFGLRRLRRK